MYSPTREVDAAGLDVRALIAPNHFHYLGVPEWSERFPKAHVVASAGARTRLEKKLGRGVGELERLALPLGMTWLFPEGTKNGEVWLEVERTWVVCDAFFNEPENPTGTFGLGCRLTGTTPGLRIGGTWPLLHLASRAQYRRWLTAALGERPPTRLVPSHGDVAEGEDLGQRLLALAAKL